MRSISAPASDRLRVPPGRRAISLLLAFVVEALVALLLLYLWPVFHPKDRSKPVVFGIDVNDGDTAEPETAKAKESAKRAGRAPAKAPERTPPPPTPPVTVEPPVGPPPFLVLTRRDYAASNIANMTSRATASGSNSDAAGTSGASDSDVVGQGPRGEPLYAAEWYRRPRDAELSAYLPARAAGVPEGWGLIACRTIERYHVEDCQELGESPRGSGLAGAVRQAAFQFLVRPPTKGGRPMVGSWVQIRIVYTLRGAKIE